MEVLYGLHPVGEAIRSRPGSVDHISIAKERRDARLDALLALAKANKVRISHEGRDQLTRMAKTDQHQGAIAFLRERKQLAIEDLLAVQKPEGEHRFFLALDGVEDPHNLGALLRTADGAGVDGVLLPERRAVGVNATVAKSSAGASEHVRVATVTNLVRALEKMKHENIWVVGLDERGTPDYTDFDFKTDMVLVLGREGAGLHDLVKKTCDHLLRIPMAGNVPSLNVSVAGAVVMYEAARQRREAARGVTNAASKPSKPRKGLGS